jgi:flagellar assembly factor FliW
MPVALTRDFGELAYEPAQEWHFAHGLPGFEDQNHFILIERPGFAPIVFLQSLKNPGLCFLAVSVWIADPAYQVGITPDDLDALGLSGQPQPGDETLCLAILSRGGDGFTANLLAPVVCNPLTRGAMQAVRADAIYSHRDPLRLEALRCL